jgi:hypothetical protein
MMALYGEPLVSGAPPLLDVLVHASDEATLKDFAVAKHDFRGQWDVDRGGARGTDGSSGSYMTALYTEGGATADKDVKITGKWVTACTGAQQCKASINSAFNYSGTTSNTLTKSNKVSLSQAIKASIGAFVESTTTVGYEATVEDAATIAKTKDVGFSQGCELTFDFVQFDIFKVWQWQIEAEWPDKSTALIQACEATCTPDATPPKAVPGDKVLVGACLKPR